MPDAPDEQQWRLGEAGPIDRMAVASRLASLEPLGELVYRELALEAVVIDVMPCQRTVADILYRFFRLRPLGWAVSGMPCRHGLPEEWTSEAISIPRRSRDGMDSHLAQFETEFAVHTFLHGVEREIDALLDRLTATPAGDPSTGPRDAGGAPHGRASDDARTACM